MDHSLATTILSFWKTPNKGMDPGLFFDWVQIRLDCIKWGRWVLGVRSSEYHSSLNIIDYNHDALYIYIYIYTHI